MAECSCEVKASERRSAVVRGPFSKYAVYLDERDDGTVFDPACPFHGENGSMVATFPAPVLPSVDSEEENEGGGGG